MSVDPTDRSGVDRSAEILSKARRALVITGAGMSADSGLPTYRGVGGLYEDAGTEDGIAIEEVLSGSMFRRWPELTWKYIAQLELAYRGKRFNRGHEILASMQEKLRLCVLTQNVDGFHRDAGSTDVIEIHGEIRKLYCTGCRWRTVVRDYADLEIPPRCPKCRSMVRPDVVLFDEMIDGGRLSALASFLEEGVDAVITIGTSALFPYIVDPILWAKAGSIPTIEINPAITDISRIVDVRVPDRAAAALEAIWRIL